jgi:hypothetical protein
MVRSPRSLQRRTTRRVEARYRCRSQRTWSHTFVQLWHQGSVSHRSLYETGGCPRTLHSQPEQLIHANRGKVPSETPREMDLHDIKQAVKTLDVPTSRTRCGLRWCPKFRADMFASSNSSRMRSPIDEPTPTAGRSRIARASSSMRSEAVLEVWPSNRVGSRLGL